MPEDLASGSPDRPSLFAILRRRWLIVVLVPVLCGAVAAVFALVNERDYQSEAKLLFPQTISTELNSVDLDPTAPDATNLANSNAEVVGSRDVAAATSAQLTSARDGPIPRGRRRRRDGLDAGGQQHRDRRRPAHLG